MESSPFLLTAFQEDLRQHPCPERANKHAFQEFREKWRRIRLKAVKRGQLEILEWMRNETSFPPCYGEDAKKAAVYGQLETLRWMSTHGHTFDADVMREAIGSGHLHVIHWLESLGVDYPANADCAAAQDLSLLKWCIEEKKMTWTTDAYDIAAEKGKIENLAYLRSRPEATKLWTEYEDTWDSPCGTAARWGQLETLQWLRAQQPPCPWGYAVHWAASRSQLAILQWLYTQPDSGFDIENVCHDLEDHKVNGVYEVGLWLQTLPAYDVIRQMYASVYRRLDGKH